MKISDYISVEVKITPPMHNYSYLLCDFYGSYKLPKQYEYAKPDNSWRCLTTTFLESNQLPGKLSLTGPYNCDFLVEFVEHLPAGICEDVYKTLAYYKPIGCCLLTNRSDLFAKEKEAHKELSELRKKESKLEKKLNKVRSKMEEIKSTFEGV